MDPLTGAGQTTVHPRVLFPWVHRWHHAFAVLDPILGTPGHPGVEPLPPAVCRRAAY
jgi:sterol desaturase/sphingolipid hydroxylase (fatty acid hydroxylase superfamily)